MVALALPPPCWATASTEPHHNLPPLNSEIPSQRRICPTRVLKEGKWYLMMVLSAASEAALSGARSRHLIVNCESVSNKGRTFCFFPFYPLSIDLLTERQVGVGVQVTGASVVAISITQLAARCYSAICAAAGWRNNGCKWQAESYTFTRSTNDTVGGFVKHMYNSCSRAEFSCLLVHRRYQNLRNNWSLIKSVHAAFPKKWRVKP